MSLILDDMNQRSAVKAKLQKLVSEESNLKTAYRNKMNKDDIFSFDDDGEIDKLIV